jgi:type III secretion protein R
MTTSYAERLSLGLVTLVAAVAFPALAAAQEVATTVSPGSPVVMSVLLAVLGLLPFALVVLTSFAKIAVVLSLLRTALGTPSVPPATVITTLAAILTIFVMAPVFAALGEQLPGLWQVANDPASDPFVIAAAAGQAMEPWRQFLAANAGTGELALFAELRGTTLPADVLATPFTIAAPAFALTELSEAFQMGFLLFLPFLVLDLVVGSVLLGLGMHMLSPSSVALPFKLLLFVAVNGWVLLSRSLVMSYIFPGVTP